LSVRQPRLFFQRGAWNGVQHIDRDGRNTQISQGKRHFNPVAHGFAHPNDPSAAKLHTGLRGVFQRLDFFVVSMGSADFWKKAPGSFQVAVVA
jgi:hypothetical protein